MNNGEIEQIGTAEDLYERPANRFVASFIGESNFLEGRVSDRDEKAIQVTSDKGIKFSIPNEYDFGIGDNICTVLRPEKLTFLRVGEKRAGWNMLEGVIEEEIYLGEIRRYKVEILKGQVLSIKISNAAEAEHCKRGNRVTVGWKWNDGIIVP